ncbi:lysine--tRNA ligase [Candidatus Thorarchaeota archaeon]|nr:MAG: lysine--tRNA ligase [Candidatus Thorarchaeota archaeon]
MTMPQDDDQEFSIHWIQDVVERVLARDVENYLISAGKSPSGRIHIGILRELIVCDVIKRRLLERGKAARTMFVIDDYDPVRSFPPGTSLSLEDYAGIPYSDVPDEFGCCESYGAHWANELIETFPEFGLDPEIVWNSKLYETPEMLEEVRICLRKTETIRDIMVEYVARDFDGEQKQQYTEAMKDWFPASVVCPQCGRLQSGVKGGIEPNRITGYVADSDEVSFECPGCGHAATLPLEDVRVKLTWRVDWPAKWHLFEVTCEPAGKDHAVKGGSYDTGLEVSRRVFGWEGPVKVPYEWVQIGGRDMTTSEGIVFIPKTWLSIAPPELYRFLMLKTDLRRTINIQPDRIPDLVDNYERFERAYYGVGDITQEERELAHLLYPLSEPISPSEHFIPKLSYKFAIVTSQLEDLLGKDVVMERCKDAIRKQHGIDEIPPVTLKHIPMRLSRAKTWVHEFGSKRDQIQVTEEVPEKVQRDLKETDRQFLSQMLEIFKGPPKEDEELQTAVFETARRIGIKPRRAFTVFYQVLISRKSGPRLGPFLNLLGPDWVASRIESVL